MSALLESPFFGVTITIVAYWIGVKIQQKTKLAICNYMLIAVVLLVAVLVVFDIPYESYYVGGNLINLFFSTTGGVGELSNFLLGAIFVFVAGMFYRYMGGRKGALIGSLCGAAAMAVTAPAGTLPALPGVSARAGTSTQDAPASRTAACAVSNRISPGVMQTVPAGIGRSVSAALATENRMLPSAAVACFRLSPRSWAWLSRQLPAAVWGKHCRSTQSAWAYRAYTWAATA